MKNLYPKINIVVLNYNSQDRLRRCLTSLFCLDYPNFEVVVVDNNSKDGSLEKARLDFSRATFIKNKHNLGFSAGNNVGIKYSLEKMADFVLLLSSDAEVEKSFLANLVENALEDNSIGMLGPVIFSGKSERVWFSGGKIDWLRMRAVRKKKLPKKDFSSTSFISSRAMLVRAEVFAKIGLLDENFFLYWEDVDFSLRAKKVGFQLFVLANSRVFRFEKEAKQKENNVYWSVFSRLLFFQRNAFRGLKPWIFSYNFLGRIKNWKELQKKKTKRGLAVQKAYEDFRKIKSTGF